MIRKILFNLHLFVGFGAISGGIFAISDPNGEIIGLEISTLKNFIFENLIIPGIFLLVVIGFGNLFSAYLMKKHHKLQIYFNGTLGKILVLWIIIQCYMLWTINILHIVFLFIGLMQLVLAIVLAFKDRVTSK